MAGGSVTILLGFLHPALWAKLWTARGWLHSAWSMAPACRRAVVVFGHLWSRAHESPLRAPGTLVSFPQPTQTQRLGMPPTCTIVWECILGCSLIGWAGPCCLTFPCLHSLNEASLCETVSQACSASGILWPLCRISGTGQAALAARARCAGSTCLRHRTHPQPCDL